MFTYPEERWTLAGHKRWAWIAITLFAFLVGVLHYAATVRHHLRYPDRYIEVDGVAPADR